MYKNSIDSDFGWTKPSEFNIITEEETFGELIDTVNRELYDRASEDYRENDIISIEIEDDNYNEVMLIEACDMFKTEGEWPKVTYERFQEKNDEDSDEDSDDVDDDSCNYIRFTFYLKDNNLTT